MTSLSLFLILGFMRFATHPSLLRAHTHTRRAIRSMQRQCDTRPLVMYLDRHRVANYCVCVCWMHFPNEFCIIVLISTGSLIGCSTETKNWIVDYVIRVIWNAVHWRLLQPHKHNTHTQGRHFSVSNLVESFLINVKFSLKTIISMLEIEYQTNHCIRRNAKWINLPKMESKPISFCS